MSKLHTIMALLLALGPLIVFHELGHYLIARLCGVKVLRFSFGIGRVIWSRRFGRDDTEWVISAFPIGGYVKMLDSRDPDALPVSPEDAKREFGAQSVWRRMAIIAAGPIANFILAIAIFAGLNMHGVSENDTRIRAMPDNVPAAQAGLRGGDRISSVNGTPVVAWSELRWELLQAVLDGRDARLDVERPGAGQLSFVIPVAALGKIEGDSDVLALTGLSLARSPAHLTEVDPAGPGAKAGLSKGDVITALGGKPVHDGIDLFQALQANGGKEVEVVFQRRDVTMTVLAKPERDEKLKIWRLMVSHDSAPENVVVRSGPISGVAKAMATVWDSAVLRLKIIGKIITMQMSSKNVTGIFTIGDYAGQTLSLGPTVFLGFIAMVSISLGVMNLLPIPVLDGGHLLYYSLEVLTGRPLPDRVNEYAQRVGVGLLVMLMGLALFNDMVRYLL